MMHEIPLRPVKERAILVGAGSDARHKTVLEEHLNELALLADTAGAEVVARVLQIRPEIDSALFIGRGKANELKDLLHKSKGNLVIFDEELSPGQTRNLQELLETKVIDRTDLILDIFARHARTNESKIQVELAQLQHLLPRLSRAYSHFEQQTGGIGTRRGPGETQLETDRRAVQKRISDLKEKLEKIERVHQESRKMRHRIGQVCLVGYTNAGKSTLMNALVKSHVKVENRLFSTLDTTTRRLYLDKAGTILLSDTVGFIRKLPVHLVESFKSTLDVTRDADLLLHVVDATSAELESHVAIVEETLNQLTAGHIARILIFNKIDLLPDPARMVALSRAYPEAFFLSAGVGTGLDALRNALDDFFGRIPRLNPEAAGRPV